MIRPGAGLGGLAGVVAANVGELRFTAHGDLIFTSLMVVSIAGLFCAIASPGSGFRQVCSAPVLAAIGSMSFSLYLTHLQVIHFLAMLTAGLLAGLPHDAVLAASIAVQAPIVLVVGAVFFIAVERPSMQLAWRASRGKALGSPRKPGALRLRQAGALAAAA